jgi:hypothetical protein
MKLIIAGISILLLFLSVYITSYFAVVKAMDLSCRGKSFRYIVSAIPNGIGWHDNYDGSDSENRCYLKYKTTLQLNETGEVLASHLEVLFYIFPFGKLNWKYNFMEGK